MKLKKYFPLLAIAIFTIFYFTSHLFSLTLLPVFADESIYIRWTQLIIDDWKQYLFFPLNDGKTPFQMWLMVPFQFIFSDQLFAGRFLSVLIGFFQAITLSLIVKELGGRKKTQLLTLFLSSILPFWFFHHRMALIDGLLTFLLSVSILFFIQVIKNFDSAKIKPSIIKSLLSGLFFGLSLITKLPSILFAPIFLILVFLSKKEKLNNYLKLSLFSFVTIGTGLFIFILLKLHPAFGQLFSRGSDFLFSPKDIWAGEWKQSIANIPRFMSYFAQYLTIPILILSFIGLFFDKIRKKQSVLIISTLIFLFPITILGKVVYPRYLMPASIFLTVAGVLTFQELIDRFINQEKKLIVKIVASLIIVQFFSSIFISSTIFISSALSNADEIPFVLIDKHQYLYDWSSGHGILEAVNLIKEKSKNEKILILTEGYFGTLPDALLMYFHKQNVSNIFIQGIGQPVNNIPSEMIKKSMEFDKTWLVVNSHRLNIKLPPEKLIQETCRSKNFPCLQIWDITEFINKAP